MLGPRLIARLVSVVGLPLARALPLSGALGRQNAVRNPERTAATASTLMIGLALLTFVTVLGTSTKAYIEAQVNSSQVDFELLSDEQAGGKSSGQPMSPDLVARLSALPELRSVVPIAGAAAIDPLALSQVLDVGVVRGSLGELTRGGIGVAVMPASISRLSSRSQDLDRGARIDGEAHVRMPLAIGRGERRDHRQRGRDRGDAEPARSGHGAAH